MASERSTPDPPHEAVSPTPLRWPNLHGNAFQRCPVLVTGGAGFIGSHLSEALLTLGAHVTILDDLSGGERANLDSFREQAGERLRFVEGSILDVELVRACTRGARYVFHQAAVGSVPASVEQPVRYHAVNSTGTLHVLEAAREAGVTRVMFAASSSAYGDSQMHPQIESVAVQPKSPYAATKVAGEALLRAYASSYEIDTVSLRYFNVFGPRQNANSAYAAVIAAFAKALLAGERPRIFGDGEQSRDFTHVANVVHANLLAARAAARLSGQVLNVACGRGVSVNELAHLMARQLNRADLTPDYLAERTGDVKHSLADLTQAAEAIDYKPLVAFEQGLVETTSWYQTGVDAV